jgi:hypothetical protein
MNIADLQNVPIPTTKTNLVKQFLNYHPDQDKTKKNPDCSGFLINISKLTSISISF